jgi:hypothetical protein
MIKERFSGVERSAVLQACTPGGNPFYLLS